MHTTGDGEMVSNWYQASFTGRVNHQCDASILWTTYIQSFFQTLSRPAICSLVEELEQSLFVIIGL